jgi:hypothetical protein
MAPTNCELSGIHFIADLSADSEEEKVPHVSQKFLDSLSPRAKLKERQF